MASTARVSFQSHAYQNVNRASGRTVTRLDNYEYYAIGAPLAREGRKKSFKGNRTSLCKPNASCIPATYLTCLTCLVGTYLLCRCSRLLQGRRLAVLSKAFLLSGMLPPSLILTVLQVSSNMDKLDCWLKS